MAKQKGSIKYVGTIGDIRHFKIKGKEGYFAGMVGGPTGEQIKTAPEFARTRENMSEFGACAKAGKSFRMAFNQFSKGKTDSSLTGRLTSVMKKINLEDNSNPRGKRDINISENKEYLNGFEFDKNKSLNGVLGVPYTNVYQESDKESIITIAAHSPIDSINAPAGSTHYTLRGIIASVSDFHYNETTGIYEAKNPAANEIAEYAEEELIDLSTSTDELVLDASLPDEVDFSSDVAFIQCLSIEFYQKVGDEYYKFNQGNCMSVVGVY